MYALLRVFILFGVSILMAGCNHKNISTEVQPAAQPLEFKVVKNDIPNQEVIENGGYVSIRFEYINYYNTKSGFLRKLLLQKKKNVVVTATINYGDRSYTLPIFYLETREADNFAKFQNQQGGWLLPKTFIDSEKEVSIGFKWTEVEDNDSGIIKETIDQVGSLVEIFKPGTMNVINSVTKTIDGVIKKYSKSSYDLGSISGYRIKDLCSINNLVLCQGDSVSSLEKSINELPSTTTDYQSAPINNRPPYDYAMMSCSITGSCFKEGKLSESPFYKTISHLIKKLSKYKEISGKVTTFQEDIIPAINNLKLSPNDESAFMVYIANSNGLWRGDLQYVITDDDIARAASLKVDKAIPIEMRAYEFMNEWMGGSIANDIVSSDKIHVEKDETVLPAFKDKYIDLDILCTLQIEPLDKKNVFEDSSKISQTSNSVTFNAKLRSGESQNDIYRITIAFNKNKVSKVTIRKPMGDV